MIASAIASAGAGSPGDREIVRVNGTPIRQSEIVERVLRMHGRETLEAMINELLVRQTAHEKKIAADAAVLDKRISRMRSNFTNAKAFENQLNQIGATEADIRREMQAQLIAEKLIVDTNKLSVNDAEVKSAFDRNKGRMGKPPASHLRHILVKTQADADAILAQVKAGADFKKLAKEKSLAQSGKVGGGDYGFVTAGMLPPDIEKTVFAMQPGDLKVLPTPLGHHVLQVLATRPGEPAVYGKIKDDLKEMLLAEKIQNALPLFIQELRQKADIKYQGDQDAAPAPAPAKP